MSTNALDRAIEWVSPKWASGRLRERMRLEAVRAYYDGATLGRRSASLRRKRADANSIAEATLFTLREHHRDLERNNAHARRAIEAIVTNTIGIGIRPYFRRGEERALDIEELAKRSLYTTDIDSDGRCTYLGMQSVGFRSTVRDGEGLVRRRWRRPGDGFAVPVQFQLLEPDYIDETRNGPTPTGAVIQGVEYDMLGRRRVYWLFREHPGSNRRKSSESHPVPASEIAHCYRVDRPGQVRGLPWGAAVVLGHADFHDYEDAQGVRQKIAACFAAFVEEGFDNIGMPGSVRQDADRKLIDELEPGIVERLPLGSKIVFADPPGVDGYGEYAGITLHKIAAGWGISYEALTGDLHGTSFSSGKMGRLEFERNIDGWQQHVVIPTFCDPLMRWWLEAAALAGADVEGVSVGHQPPARGVVDPTREGPAERAMVRAGKKTLSQWIREGGGDPELHFEEYAEDMKRLDRLGIALDSDVRNDANQQGRTGQQAPREDVDPAREEDEMEEAVALLLERLRSRGSLNGRRS